MVLKKHRKHARKLLDASFKRRPKPVYCEIPSLYMSVINFAKKYGFVEINKEPRAHKKNDSCFVEQKNYSVVRRNVGVLKA